MVQKRKFALLGTGFIGQVHAKNLAAHPDIELVMVADQDRSRADDIASRYGARVGSVTEAINSDAIDTILIATSTPSHAEFLAASAAAGKAVYCEKPIDLSLDKARRVVEEVARHPVPVTVGFNRRFDPSHNQLKQHLQQGLIGKAELIQMVCRASELPPLSYLQTSGGQMRDQAIHFFDLLRWLTEDEVETIGAMGSALAMPEIASFGDVDTSVLMMKMRSGALAQLDNTRRTGYGYDERITVLGSQGMSDSAAQSPQGATLYSTSGINRPPLYADWFNRVKETYYLHLDAFVRSLNGEAVSVPGLHDGLQAQAIAEAAVKSLETGTFCKVEQL
ncbi:Gfo/Idh/MocA family oxidoreductase [Erwinia sp. S43]|uniref:Gfo/Idh/MocA family oxidoreductase n=1 Tax=Erwinia sp. S43 TaxID=2769339 RepID=UPI0019098152|nr:Gfo/Idh/MocA family oxidoreductase [Erwinia sp. S43]MBK0030832.1 Gfo/Idh/MocA family oxidoreductase [Erwinia sp. S43]